MGKQISRFFKLSESGEAGTGQYGHDSMTVDEPASDMAKNEPFPAPNQGSSWEGYMKVDSGHNAREHDDDDATGKASDEKLEDDELVYYNTEHILVGDDPKVEETLYECYCGEDFDSRQEFKMHLVENKMRPPEQKMIYECKKCAEAAAKSPTIFGSPLRFFLGYEKYQSHVLEYHGDEGE